MAVKDVGYEGQRGLELDLTSSRSCPGKGFVFSCPELYGPIKKMLRDLTGNRKWI